jgi:hypothetical protein
MTRRLWVALLYFGMIKVVVGTLGVAGIVITVVQPAVAICSGGHAPLSANELTLRESLSAYSVVILFTWTVGAVGLAVLAKLSVQVTARLCAESRYRMIATVTQRLRLTTMSRQQSYEHQRKRPTRYASQSSNRQQPSQVQQGQRCSK